MPSDIGPGDYVKYIGTKSTVLRCDGVYLVSRIGPTLPCRWCGGNHAGLGILGKRSKHRTGCFALCNFRPFKGPEIESKLFRAAPKRVQKYKEPKHAHT